MMDDQKLTSAAIRKQFAAGRAAQEAEDEDEDPEDDEDDEDGELSAQVARVPSAYLLLCGVSDAAVMMLLIRG